MNSHASAGLGVMNEVSCPASILGQRACCRDSQLDPANKAHHNTQTNYKSSIKIISFACNCVIYSLCLFLYIYVYTAILYWVSYYGWDIQFDTTSINVLILKRNHTKNPSWPENVQVFQITKNIYIMHASFGYSIWEVLLYKHLILNIITLCVCVCVCVYVWQLLISFLVLFYTCAYYNYIHICKHIYN